MQHKSELRIMWLNFQFERGSSRSHSLENSLWKKLWTCRKREYAMNGRTNEYMTTLSNVRLCTYVKRSPVDVQTPTLWYMIGRSMTALPSVLLLRSILPLYSVFLRFLSREGKFRALWKRVISIVLYCKNCLNLNLVSLKLPYVGNRCIVTRMLKTANEQRRFKKTNKMQQLFGY